MEIENGVLEFILWKMGSYVGCQSGGDRCSGGSTINWLTFTDRDHSLLVTFCISQTLFMGNNIFMPCYMMMPDEKEI